MHNEVLKPALLYRWLVYSLIFFLPGVALASPDILSWTTPKGAKVMFVQADGLPMVDVRVVMDAGSARDGKYPGLASFTSNMLTEGAGDWDANQLATRLEDQGIEIGSGSLRDMAWVRVRSLSEAETLAVALDSLAEVLANPAFDNKAIERVRQQMQIGLRRALQSPGTVAQRRFYHTLYGDHPYAHPSSGTEESLAQISKGNLQTFHRSHYVARNAVVSIVGAVDRTQAEAIAERVTAGLPGGKHAPALPAPSEVQGGELRVAFPSKQTHIYVGQLGTQRHDADYFPLYVGNHAFGGGSLVSLLADEVRHKRGLSYSVYSYFSPMRSKGPFLMVAQTKNTQASEALDVMKETLQRFIERGPTEKELNDAKLNIAGGFPLKVSSNKKIVNYISMIGFYDLPLDWLDTLVAKVEAVTVEQVSDAFRRRVSVDKSIAVVVGGQAE